MNLKDKLKTFAIGMGLGVTTLTGCSESKQTDKEPIDDMLAIDKIVDVDIYNKPVSLHKVEIPVYKDNNMKDEGYKQLVWGLDNSEEISLKRTRSGQKTHLEEYELPNGDKFWVETYNDGVLKANNSLIVIDRKIQVIGDDENYALNLQRRAEELQLKALQKKREKLEKIKEQERSNMRRSNNVKTEIETKKDSVVVADSTEVKDTLQEAETRKHHIDSVSFDTLRQIQIRERS